MESGPTFGSLDSLLGDRGMGFVLALCPATNGMGASQPAIPFLRCSGRTLPSPAGGNQSQIPGLFAAPAQSASQRQRINKRLLALTERYAQQLRSCPADYLESQILPHPALGKVTVREMALFSTYHGRLHLGLIQRDLNAAKGNGN